MAEGKTKAPTRKLTKTATKKAAATKSPQPSGGATKKPRIFAMLFASVYPLYVQKAERKGRTKEGSP